MHAPSATYQKFIEYQQKYLTPPFWRKHTLHEFWREFVDGIQHDINISRFNYYQNSFKELFESVQQMTKMEFESAFPHLEEHLPKEMYPHETLYQALLGLNGWVPFERREHRYLISMCKAKIWLNQQGKRRIDAEFIKQLHKICMSGVQGTNFDFTKDGLSKIGNFRTLDDESKMFMGIGQFGNVTSKGMDEFLEALHKGETAFKIMKMESLKYVVKFDSQKNCLVLMNFGPLPVNEKYIYDREKIKNILWTDLEIAQSSDPRTLNIVSRTRNDHPPLFQRISEEINLLYKKLDACNALEIENERNYQKLWEIAAFVQKICRIHPFRDGNTRTLVMLLLPYLLEQAGFGNICIFNNPNRLWMYSIEECVAEIIDGLINAQNLTAGIPCELSTKVKTNDILDALSSEEKANFNDCLHIFPYKKEYIDKEFSLFSPICEKSSEGDEPFHFMNPLG